MTAPRFPSVEALLDDARTRLRRVSAVQAWEDIAHGARLVDIRPVAQRAVAGEIPGSLIIERNHLEWRLHPDSDAKHSSVRPGQRWIVVCAEGYTSSLAADALLSLGVPATDVVGGIEAWRDAALPLVEGPTPVEQIVPG